jgi:hypothetical protein
MQREHEGDIDADALGRRAGYRDVPVRDRVVREDDESK